MQIVVLGCGYGRESAMFSPFVKTIYGLDVDPGILEEASQNMKERQLNNFIPVLYDNWKETIPAEIDLIYSITVFQHLTKHLVIDYLHHFNKKLKPGGRFICQFMDSEQTGSYDAFCEDYEPHVSWSVSEIEAAFQSNGFQINALERNLVFPEEGIYWIWVDAQKMDKLPADSSR